MKFLVDNQLPVLLADFLARRGIDCIHVQNIGMGQATDREIWNLACNENRTVITKDDDYLHLQRLQPGTAVLWVRLGNCRNHRLLLAFENSWPEITRHLNSGNPLVILRDELKSSY